MVGDGDGDGAQRKEERRRLPLSAPLHGMKRTGASSPVACLMLAAATTASSGSGRDMLG